MKKNSLLARYDKDLRLHITYPEARREVTHDVVRFVRRAPGMNFVSFTFANERKIGQAIDNQVAYFMPMNQPFTWKAYEHDLLPSLEQQLVSRGFVNDEDPGDVMVLNVNEAPAYLFQPVTADIRRITHPEGLKDIIHILDAVYGGHNAWVNERMGMHLQVPDYLSAYVAYVDNKPASIAWTYFPPGHFATLFGGSTVPEYRKLGLYTSLLATRLKEIRGRGIQFAVVEAGPMSRPIVAKHGFQHLTTAHDYVWQGS